MADVSQQSLYALMVLSIIIVLFFLYYDSCTMVRATFSIGEAFSTHLQNLISRTPFKKRTPTVREEKPLSAQLQTSQKNQLQTSAHVTMQPSSKVLTYNGIFLSKRFCFSRLIVIFIHQLIILRLVMVKILCISCTVHTLQLNWILKNIDKRFVI